MEGLRRGSSKRRVRLCERGSLRAACYEAYEERCISLAFWESKGFCFTLSRASWRRTIPHHIGM
jgi:hypothetical protein